ncbi:MAG: chemotaxis protein CheA [bacterium]
MSAQDIDKEELEIFLSEMEELLQILEEDIVKLEKQPENPSILAEIFRAAHTIKGSSASMGFPRLSELAHGMETVFGGVRSGSIQVSMELIDTFLQCSDTLQKIKDEISKDCEVKSEIQTHLDDLRLLLQPKKKSSGDDQKKQAQEENAPAAKTGGQIHIVIKLDAAPQCQMPFVRALQALTFFSELGEIINSSPTIKEIEQELLAFPMTLEVITSAGRSKIEEVLSLISDVVLIECNENAVMSEEPAAAGDEEESSPAPENESDPAGPQESDAEQQQPETPEDGGAGPETEEAALVPIAGGMQAQNGGEAKKEQPQDDRKKLAGRTVRVDVERMDAIMDLVGELVINRTRLAQLSRILDASSETDDIVGYLSETSDNIELISTQLQEHIMKARLLPIENVFNKFPRMVRDLANKTGKKIDLVLEGEKTELDRSVLEEIGDPLMHTIRNSIDHGIEPLEERIKAGKPPTGKIVISADHVEDHILITVVDDGKGIDPQKVMNRAKKLNIAPSETLAIMKEQDVLDLVFLPGFSTKEEVTEVSGRGVGMDVVRTNIKKLNGSVTLQSAPGKGTKVIIKLPLTLAIIKSLLVTMGRRIFAIPLISVVQTLRVEQSELKALKGKEAILFRGNVLPLIRLEEALALKRGPDEHEPSRVFIVVVAWAGRRVGIIVDSLIGDQEIVIRPLGEYIGEAPGISGAAILGDGKITLIIDIGGFIKIKLDELDAAAQSENAN